MDGLQGLERTVLIGLKRQNACLVSDSRMEEGLKGLGVAVRSEWQEGFCRAQCLTAETVVQGVMFTRLPAGEIAGGE